MNIFILNTGRCGSTTFIKACQHISNFTSAHESRSGLLGQARFDYPKNHIEADNRLSWFLGKLDRYYGDNAIYVHLKRSNIDTANSVANRMVRNGIIKAYEKSLLIDLSNDNSRMSVALDYCDTVNSNIEQFLKDKTKKMNFNIENAEYDFLKFMKFIGAEGVIHDSLSEFNTHYNSSKEQVGSRKRGGIYLRVYSKLGRLLRKLPSFIKSA